MSQTVVADFTGKFAAEETGGDGPVGGRILLSREQLVLATGDTKTVIPLDDIFDVGVGRVPPDMGEFFDSTVTVAYRAGEGRYVAVVEADDEKIEKFSTVLFRVILNGTAVTVKHPAKVGGRITDEPFRTARLNCRPGTVAFEGEDGGFEVDLSSVVGFERVSRDIKGATRPALSVRHRVDGQTVTSLAATAGQREMGLLGRYLRKEYTDLVGDLREVDLSEQEVEVLVAIYTAPGDVSVAKVLDAEASQVTMLLNDLQEHELVADTGSGTELTAKGRVVVNNRLENVNA
jgi:helix-turn-helix protein